MINQYLDEGILLLMYNIPISLILFGTITCTKWIAKKRVNLTVIKMLFEYLWILYVLTILKITGISGIIDCLFHSGELNIHYMRFSLTPFEEGFSMMMLLNGLLFIPFGFLSAIVFKKLQKKQIYGLLIGLLFSGAIEFLQLFIGRYAQIDDLLMNTLGTFLGYEIWLVLSKLTTMLWRQKAAVQN